MKYLKTFENLENRLHFDDIEKSPILKDLYYTIKKESKCQNIHQSNFYIDSGILWILCRYKARNRTEIIANDDSGYYKSIMKYIKAMLEAHNPYVEKVFYEYKNRIAPLRMDSGSGELQSANQCIYEIKCYIKKEFIPIIIDEIEMVNTANKYNL